jgi:hypothetical protein
MTETPRANWIDRNTILAVLQTIQWSGWKWEKYCFDKSDGDRCCPICNATYYHPNTENEHLVTKHKDNCALKLLIRQLQMETTMPKDWRPPIGTRVLLLNHRFYPNRTGVVIRHDIWLGKQAVVVKLDSGETPGVTSPEQFEVLEEWI